MQKQAAKPRPTIGWGSPLAAALAHDAARRRPKVTLPALRFLSDDGGSARPKRRAELVGEFAFRLTAPVDRLEKITA